MEVPAILKGKHGKIFLFAALGVALLAFIMRKKGGGETIAYEGYPTGTTTADVGASGGQYNADTSNMITPAQLMSSLEMLGNSFSDQLANEHDYQAAQLGTLQSQNLTALNSLTSGLQSKFDSINTQVANSHSEMLSHTPDYSGLVSAIKAIAQPVQEVGQSVYGFMEVPSASVTSGNAIAGGSSSDLQKLHTTPAASPVINHTPNYGNGGVNYGSATDAQRRQMEDNAKRIATDSAYVTSEITRTNQVIKDRQAAGMDVTAQNKYLGTLNSQKAG